MGKSKIERLKAALDAGDLEKAKQLAGEIAVKAPRRPAKASARRKATKTPPPATDASEGRIDDLVEEVIPINGVISDAGCIAPSNVSFDRQTRVGDDGIVRVAARHESMQGKGKLIVPQDEGVKLTKKQQKIEQELAGQEMVARRPPSQKMMISCEGCNNPFSVYPTEIMLAYDENYRPYKFYKCDRCIRRGK
jgi:hypothetical protein